MSVAMAVVTAMGGVFAFFVRVGMGMRAFIVSYRGGAVEPTHFEYVLFWWVLCKKEGFSLGEIA